VLKISASILSADFARLADEIADVEAAGVDGLHIDVMDGHYVPNITMGPAVVRGAASVASVPLDAHLMISDPARYADDFIAAGVSRICFHPEVAADPIALLSSIKKKGVQAGLAVNPDSDVDSMKRLFPKADYVLVMTVFPGFSGQKFIPSALDNVRRVRAVFKRDIAVDGGVSPRNARKVYQAGGNVFVVASAVFGRKDRAAAVRTLRAAALGED
jgi:ribulose-phosphate 3-epimerase